MDANGYTTLTRQTGLLREMQLIANNIANAATTGFRQEGQIFSEYVVGTDHGPSLSMATARVRNTSHAQGTLTQTGGQYDFAIEGEGFFLVETPNGERLTRAGRFAVSAEGDLITLEGHRVLGAGGAPIFIPPDVDNIDASGDGTLSTDGQPIGQLGVVVPNDISALVREGGVLFRSDAALEPAPQAKVVQSHLESSNVDTMLQLSRMIEVQRAYELGQSFMDTESQRIRDAIQSFTLR